MLFTGSMAENRKIFCKSVKTYRGYLDKVFVVPGRLKNFFLRSFDISGQTFLIFFNSLWFGKA